LLAYLFFHRPDQGVDAGAYEEGLRRFHASLAAARANGFVSSRTYRVDQRYCDWYLVENSAALDSLNDAAVAGSTGPVHDAVAHMAVDGAGKLLRLAAGSADADSPYEIRFAKPRAMPYAQLYATLSRWTERPGFGLWRRMMVLGPAPEFCLLAPSAERLPAELTPEVFRREPV
jgi:hypothetical protein